MRIIYRISSFGNPDIEVTPYSGKDQKLTWNKEDDRKYDYKKELKEITLVKDDYKVFRELELTDDRCDLQTLRVLMECAINDEFTLFTGNFTMSSGTWDLDQCKVKFKVDAIDPYECIEENDDDHNILDFVLPRTVNLGVTFRIEFYNCFSGGFSPICNQTFLDNGLWSLALNQYTGTGSIYDRYYVRHTLTCPCSFIAPIGWTEVESCSGGVKKYAKLFDVESNPFIIDVVRSGSDASPYNEPIVSIDNGRKLHQVMQTLLDKACFGSGLTIVSDFLQWNPDNVSSINYVTGELNKLRNLIIFQKSDVKRPAVSGNATKGEINYKDLIEQVLNLLNCGYRIDDTVFRLEHISWFETDLGINLLSIDKKKQLQGTKKYSYDETKLPKYEKFEMMESGSADFVGTDIVYESNCVNNSPENKKTVSVDKITTDVMYCLENPSSQGDVSDDGFVIVACDPDYNVYYEPGILEANTTINNVLSWAHLHRDFWKHGRVLKTGLMNDVATDFITTVPTIKQDQFNIIMGCNYLKVFNPLDKIRATLGWGFVQTAELKLSQCSMNFDLLLDKIDESNFDQIYGDFDGDHSEDFD